METAKGTAAPTRKQAAPAKSAATKSVGARPGAVGARETSIEQAGTREAAGVAALTTKVQALLRSWGNGDAWARVELGGLLAKVQRMLGHGQWLKWVDVNVPYTVRTVQQFVKMADWSVENRALFERVAPLGPTKMVALMRLDRRRLEVLLNRRVHVVPSTGRQASLELLKQKEFKEVMKVFAKEKVKAEKPGDAVMSASRGAAKKALETIDLLIEHKGEVSKEFVANWYREMVKGLNKLAKAYGVG